MCCLLLSIGNWNSYSDNIVWRFFLWTSTSNVGSKITLSIASTLVAGANIFFFFKQPWTWPLELGVECCNLRQSRRALQSCTCVSACVLIVHELDCQAIPSRIHHANQSRTSNRLLCRFASVSVVYTAVTVNGNWCHKFSGGVCTHWCMVDGGKQFTYVLHTYVKRWILSFSALKYQPWTQSVFFAICRDT